MRPLLCGQLLLWQSFPGQPAADYRSRHSPSRQPLPLTPRTPFQPESGRHPRRTGCSTMCRAPPGHQSGTGHCAHRHHKSGRPDGGFSAPSHPAPGECAASGREPVLRIPLRSCSWLLSPSVQYRCGDMTGAEFIHHGQPEKGQRRGGFQGAGFH